MLLPLFVLGATEHVALRSSGCDQPLPSGVKAGGSVSMSGTFDGVKRTWYLYLPPDYRNTEPVPMVVATHGWGGSGSQEMKSDGLTTISGAGGNFIAAFPDGYTDNTHSGFWGSWNVVGSTQSPGPAGQICTPTADPSNADCYTSCKGCPGADGCDWTTCLNDVTPTGIGTKDVTGFLPSLYDFLEETFCVDLTREYHSGFSNGGMATYQMGASMSGRLAAIAPVAGAFHNGFFQPPTEKIPLLDIHGTADKQVPCNASTAGSTSTKALSQDGWWYNLLSDTQAGWLKANGCSQAPPLSNYVPPLISANTASRTKLGCANHGCDVVTCAWSGSHTYYGTSAADNGNLVWGFLEKYTKPTHVGYGYTTSTPLAERVRPRTSFADVRVELGEAVDALTTALGGAADALVTAPAVEDLAAAVHYGNPANGCGDDEEELVLSSGPESGRVCAPMKKGPSATNPTEAQCTLGGTLPDETNGCPTDVPSPSGGSTEWWPAVGAFPVCLQDSSPGARADTHCLLLCGPCRLGDDGMGCSDLAHAACPTGARCMTGTVKSVRQGICVYD